MGSLGAQKIHGQKTVRSEGIHRKRNLTISTLPLIISISCICHLKPAEARWLWRKAVGLPVGSWRGWLPCWALCEHEAGAAEDRGVVLLLHLRLLARLSLVVVLLESLDCRRLLSQEVDHEWHRKVGKAMAPRELHDNV